MIYFIMLEWALIFGFWPETPVTFIDYRDDRHAMCFRPIHGPRYIRVNTSHWNRIPYVYKRELMFHEFLHCERQCNANHVDFPDIMKPVVYDTLLDGSNWETLVNQVKERGECK